MTDFQRRIAYMSSMSIFRGWRARGVISDEDYSKIEAVMAKKYGIPQNSLIR